MKLFLSTDFEGTSGIVAWEQIIEGSAEYEQGRLLLTNEVNAVINGALEAGATEFVVNDSHHHMRNLHPQDLAGKATLITGRHKPLYMMQGLDGSFDGICFVSYQGSIGAERAVLSHTYNPGAIWEVRINGKVVELLEDFPIALAAKRGTFSLRPNGEMDSANLFVRELK